MADLYRERNYSKQEESRHDKTRGSVARSGWIFRYPLLKFTLPLSLSMKKF